MNLLVTGAFAWTPAELNNLQANGHSVVFMQHENAQLPCSADWVEGIVGNGIFLHHSIEQFSALRFIQLTSAGFDRVPMDYIHAHRIRICNARGVYSIPMAEFALGGVLQLYKRSSFFRHNQAMHIWEKHRSLLELYEKRVCIVGCGSVGNECAKRFRAFGCYVTGVDIKPYQSEMYERMLSIEHIDDALAVADITVLTLPYSEQTHHLINAQRFAAMKTGAVIVNIARGAIIDTGSLVDALQAHLGGAVLDVFDCEPLREDSPLWEMENVVISPHNSFVGDGNHGRMLELIMANLRDHAQ